MSDTKGITFEQVSKVALEMIANGVKPTVRSVLNLTGGKTETVAGFLRDFHDKRDHEVSKMADELGSSAIASLLANEVQSVVDRKTKSIHEIVERQKEQLAEMIELLDQKESECNHKVELIEAKSAQAINEAQDKVKSFSERIKEAELAKEQAESALLKTQSESIAQVDAAEKKASALVEAANNQINKAESETATLRQQVKELSIDQAKREIEQAELVQLKEKVNQLQIELAEQKTSVVQLKTENQNFTKDTKRLERDLINAKETELNLSKAQGQLVELQKQLSQAQRDLSQAEREISSLSQALTSKKTK